MRTLLVFAVGTIVFIAITFFEQIPVLGWLGWAVSVAAWIALSRELARGGGWEPFRSGMQVGSAGVLGAFTGFIGALTAWMAQTGNLFGFTTQPGDRFGALFGFVGASFGLLYWPVVGALVCAITAFALSARRS